MKKALLGALVALSATVVALLLFPLAQAVSGAPAGTAAAGKAYWEATTVWCSRCHGANGEGAYGPDLAGRSWRFEEFARALRKPWGVMPAYTERQASDQNIADMVAYFNSLPAVAEPGPWRIEVPKDAASGYRLLIETAGCAQCHGGVLNQVRRAAGGVGADFKWFEEEIYEHTLATPTGRMGNYSRARLPEAVLEEIWHYVSVDMGLRAPVTATVAATAAADGAVTYRLTLQNTGEKGKGLAAGEVYISMLVPAGSSVASASTTGYQGVQRYTAGDADVAVWLAPRIAAGETLTYTLTVSGSGAASGAHAYARWMSPTRWLQPGIANDYVQTAHVRP